MGTPSTTATAAITTTTNTNDNSSSKHLSWDENAIEEHDQLRGTRMKIEEPNTPFVHYGSGQESDDSRRPKSPITQKMLSVGITCWQQSWIVLLLFEMPIPPALRRMEAMYLTPRSANK